MSSWYPNVESYSEHLSKNSYIRDITGQIIKTGNSIQDKISKQTYEIVASQEQLSKVFGEGFNSIAETLDLGFNQLDSSLQDINASINSLQSSFEYGIGLLLTQMQTQNKLISDLINKIDAIHETLQNPTLTKAREFYRLGCERLQKGLLDKALESFLEAEKYNDTDFFTQFNIGLLFLYGIDDDDNVVDLKKAKQHLLLASRYAKAEIITDPSFTKLAAEALFNASLSVYFQLGDRQINIDIENTYELLNYCKQLATEAIKLNPQFAEAYYHLAIYSTLLKDISGVIPNLEKSIDIDRNYALKVCENHVFDELRSHVDNLLINRKLIVKANSENFLSTVKNLLEDIASWNPEDSIIRTTFNDCQKYFIKAINDHNSNTYFGFLDAIRLFNIIMTETAALKSIRITELNEQVDKNISMIKGKLPLSFKFKTTTIIRDPSKIKDSINKINVLLKQAESSRGISYDSFQNVFAIIELAKIELATIEELVDVDDKK